MIKLYEKLRNHATPKRIAFHTSILMLIIITISGIAFRNQAIDASLPYNTYVDEGYIAVPAKQIMTKSDLNPHYFHYPSLPIYLVTAGMVLGYLHSAPDMDHHALNLNAIGRVTFPYYEKPGVIKGAKLLFAVLSATSFLFLSFTAYRAFGNAALLFMPALFLSISPLYFTESWSYLNVDIIGAVAVSFYYFCIYLGIDRDTYTSKALIPGIAAGIVIASKYNLFPVLLITPLAIILFSNKDRGRKIFLSTLISLLTFFLLTPYAILDMGTFVSHVAYQVNHYQTGHMGVSYSGIEHLTKNLMTIKSSYGWSLIILGVAGCFYAIKINWRHGLVLISFPVFLLIYMSSQKVFFPRNILATITLSPIFVSLGVLLIYRLLAAGIEKAPVIDALSKNTYLWLTKRAHIKYQNHRAITAALVTIILLIVFTPAYRALEPNIRQDSRNFAARWIEANIPAGATIFYPLTLGMDLRSFTVKYDLRPVNFLQRNGEEIFQQLRKQVCYVIAPEFRHRKIIEEDKIKADKVNNRTDLLLRGFKEIKTFGSVPLLIDYRVKSSWYENDFTYMPVSNNQPLFTIYKGPDKQTHNK